MPDYALRTSPDIFALVAFVAVVWVAAWFVTGRRRGDDTPRRRWLRFSVYGIFWLILISAFLFREWQRAEQAHQDGRTIMDVQQELDEVRLRADQTEQLLRDRIEVLERRLANAAEGEGGSSSGP